MDNTLIFDCDGVILDSNHVKTEAFKVLGNRFGGDVASRLVEFHQKNGGVSRFEKIKYLMNLIDCYEPTNYEKLINDYGKIVEEGLSNCTTVDGVTDLLSEFDGKQYVVSGGLETEIKQIFKKKGLSSFFAEIHGSPRTKNQIFEDLIKRRCITPSKSLFFGDSKLDCDVAREFGINFIFVYQHTEFENWESYVKNQGITYIKNFWEDNARNRIISILSNL